VEFFLGIAEVMLGLMALYDDWELPKEEDAQRLQMWDRTRINHEMAFSIRGDSTVLLDANQRIDQVTSFLKLVGQSEFINPAPVIAELASLHGFDPADVMRKPPEKGPEPPNVSFRASGAADLQNPIFLAMLMKADMAPTVEELKAAIELLRAAGSTGTLTLGSTEDTLELPVHVDGDQPMPIPPANQGAQASEEGGEPGQVAMGGERESWKTMPSIDSRHDSQG
jgi:hypothetical protein